MTLDEANAPTIAEFETVALEALERFSSEDFDRLPFGVVGMSPAGDVEIYNAEESRIVGLRPERVLGKHFFSQIAMCMNNDLVAGRYENELDLDATIDYVLALRLKPLPAKLRLLRGPSARRRYLLVQR